MRTHYLRCLKIAEETGFYYALQTASKYLGKVSTSMGMAAEAERYLTQSLSISKEIGFVRDIVNLVYELARLRETQGNLEQAVELVALVIQQPASRQLRWLEGSIRDSAQELLNKLEQELSPEVFSYSLTQGQDLVLDEVVNELLGEKSLKL